MGKNNFKNIRQNLNSNYSLTRLNRAKQSATFELKTELKRVTQNE